LFQIIAAPALRVVCFITPRLITDKHLPLVGFFFLFWLWIMLKRVLCGIDGLACG
jgi:hypothetical protein